MKLLPLAFLLLLFSCSNLCLDCDEEEGGMCPSLRPVPPELVTAIPYMDDDVVRFRSPVVDDTLSIQVERIEREPASDGSCDGLISTTLANRQSGYPFTIDIFANRYPAYGLEFNFALPVFGALEESLFLIQYDTDGNVSTDLPNTVRMIGDTTLTGSLYREVIVFTVRDTSTDTGVSRFFYNQQDGLLQIDRFNGTALVRVA